MNKEEKRIYDKKYHNKNKEKRNKISKDYYKKNKDTKIKEYRLKNRKQILLYSREYNKKNKDKNRKYYKEHKENYKLTAKKQRVKHINKIKIRNYTHRNKQKGTKCEKCGSKKNLEFHHINYNKNKVITLCRKCHINLHSEFSN